MPSIPDLIEQHRAALLQRYLEEASRWASLPPDQQPTPEDSQRLLGELQAAMEHTFSVLGGKRPSEPVSAHPPPSGGEELHLSQERHRLAVESTGLGTWDFEPLTGALHWDERCKALFGQPPDAAMSYDAFLASVHPDDRERVHHLAQRALTPAGGGTFKADFRAMGPRGGTERWVSSRGRTFFDATGRAVRFIGTVLDITERVREREAVEREKNRVITILESISEAFLAFDRNWRFIYVNREAERLLGQSREALLGREHWEVYPATQGTPLEDNYRRAAAERIPISFENYYDPWKRWFELHLYPTDEGLAVYFQDVTERKRRDAERERLLSEQTRLREQAEKALRESQRAAEVLEHGDPFLLLDKDFRIIQVNENQERVSQIRRENALGRILWDVFPTLNNPESAYWREYHRAMQERIPVQFEEYYPPQGRWASVSAYPTTEGGLALFLRDVTERKRADQFRERLVGIVSHDLRSPLNSITLAAGQLLRREDTPEPVLTKVRSILRSTERMSRMITDLLDFTRARLGGGIPLRRQPCELVELVRTTLEELEVAHPGRILFSAGQGPYSGECEPDRLVQVISNLVNNALQHGAGDTPVEVTLREEGQEILLTVRNQGSPIPEELLPHIFDPFRRAANSSRQGLGLGLYIVQQLVQAHGGSITVSSDAATGTTFTVRLPRGPGPA